MKTAVEWLQQEVILQTNLPLNLENVLIFNKLIEQANKMFEEQIMDAYNQGSNDYGSQCYQPEQYYNETFKSE
jgi:hypothetical protein